MKRLLFVVALVLFTAGSAAAKEYSAQRFDVRLELRPGGTMQVTETIEFRFSGGAFTTVFRELRQRRTDGIEIVRVAMDGEELTPGEGAGSYEVEGDTGRRVRWHFAPVNDSSHTFELTYLVSGVVRHDGGADLLWWQALPSEHAYRVEHTRIDVHLPVTPTAPIETASKNVRATTHRVDGTRVSIEALDVRKNGWVSVSIRMPQGSIIAAPPAWQQRDARAREAGPKWLLAGGAILGAGLILLFAFRQGYDAPPFEMTIASSAPALPDTLDAPVAGALVANGSVRLEHAMAALFRLADRGDVRIDEHPKGRLGQRQFDIRRAAGARPVRPYEETLLNVVFTGRHGTEESIELGKARSRVMRKLSQFRSALQTEMKAEGLLDDDRRRVIHRYRVLGVALVILGGLTLLPLIPFFDEFGPWPLAIAGAFVLVGLISLIASSALTPLSNDGVRRRRAWTAYRRYLDDAARDRVAVQGSAARLLPFAVATGVAGAWAKYLKQHDVDVPPWFRAADDTSHGFAYFVAAGGSGAGHGSGSGAAGGAGGAAGGGASGAA